MHRFLNKAKRAFSIVELSVAIVVIGVLMSLVKITSGIIENGKVQGLIYELTGYRQNIAKFYTQYSMLPGDIHNASVVLNTSLQNGNGDYSYGVISGGVNESYLAWMHLSYSGIIPGRYTGTTSLAGSQQSSPGVNLPQSKIISESGYRIGSDIPSEILQNPVFTSSAPKVILELAKYTKQNLTNGRGLSAAIKAASMSNMDIKIDDGKPMEGFLFGLNDTNNLCNSSTSNVNAGFYATNIKYLSNTSDNCILSLVLNEYK